MKDPEHKAAEVPGHKAVEAAEVPEHRAAEVPEPAGVLLKEHHIRYRK